MVRVRTLAENVADSTRSTLLDLTSDVSGINLRPCSEPLRFIFTIDTEISLGGAHVDPRLEPVGAARRIWGVTERGAYGINLFMDVFEEYDMKAVFFFETAGRHLVDPESLASAAKAIVRRGHDVELHLHPEFRMCLDEVQEGKKQVPPEELYRYSFDTQRRYLREAAEALERWTGRRPCAFRAGTFGLDESGIRALHAEGIPIDSSYNVWANRQGYSRFELSGALNDVAFLRDGVLEVPITTMLTKAPLADYRPFELSACNTSEMIAALEQLYFAGTRVCCSLSHSFRLLRTYDTRYATAELDRINLHRLRALCRYLKAYPEKFQVCTFQELPLEKWRKDLPPAPVEPFFPSPPTWTKIGRLLTQAIKDRKAL